MTHAYPRANDMGVCRASVSLPVSASSQQYRSTHSLHTHERTACNERETDPRAAGRALDDRAAFTQQPTALRVLDNALCDAVLRAPARVQELGLCLQPTRSKRTATNQQSVVRCLCCHRRAYAELDSEEALTRIVQPVARERLASSNSGVSPTNPVKPRLYARLDGLARMAADAAAAMSQSFQSESVANASENAQDQTGAGDVLIVAIAGHEMPPQCLVDSKLHQTVDVSLQNSSQCGHN